MTNVTDDQTKNTQKQQGEYTIDQLVGEQNQKRGFIYDLVDKITNKNSYKPENIQKVIEIEDKKLEQVGINLDNVPEIVKPYYVKAYNLIQSPDKRFKQTKQGIESYINELKSIENEVMQDLYGKDYNSSKQGEPSGVYGKRLELAENRESICEVVMELCNEKIETEKRITSAKQLISQTQDKAEKKKLNKSIINFEKDKDFYNRSHREIQTQFTGTEIKIKSMTEQKDSLVSLKECINDAISQAEGTLISYESVDQDIDYTKTLGNLIPLLQASLDRYAKMGGVFADNNYGKMRATAEVTKFKLENPDGNSDRPNPFEHTLKAKENRNEQTLERIRQVSKDPYKDIFD